MVFLDDETAEAQYQLAAPEGLTAEALFDARWALTLLARLWPFSGDVSEQFCEVFE